MNTLGEIKDIIKNQKDFLDYGDMKIITDLLISYFELNDFISSVEIERINPNYDSFANYYFYKRLIKLYVDNVIIKATNTYALNKMHEENVNLNIFVSLHLLQTVIHEISHARQHKILESNIKSLEKDAIELSMLPFIINNNPNRNSLVSSYLNTDDQKIIESFINDIRKYQENENCGKIWEYKPIEREADIRAWDICKLIFNNLDNNEYINKYIDFMKHIRLLRGYDVLDNNVIPPIETFLEERKKYLKKDPYTESTYKERLKLEISNNNFEDRIKYGLPITYEEGKTVAAKVKKLNIEFN